MAQKVPPLEVSKKIILDAKGAKWLNDAQATFAKTYPTVKAPDLIMWMIGKNAGLEMPEIKAAAGSGNEGTPITIQEMNKKAKTPKDQGWTFNNGGKFEKPNKQDTHCIQGVYLWHEEEETLKGKTKFKIFFTDGTGVAKIGAIGAASDTFAESGAKPGSVIRLPLVQVNYGYHNFSQEKNKLWWNFSLPPFDDALVQVVEEDAMQFFDNMEVDPPKEGHAAFTTGFITSMDEEEKEVCIKCDRWVSEKNQHEKCQKEMKEAGEEYETVNKTYYVGTGVSVNGETRRLDFKYKPRAYKVTEQVQIFGVIAKQGGLDVAFVRKVDPNAPVVTETTKAMKAARAQAVEAEEAPEEPVEEDEPAPSPAPKAKPKVVPKKPAPAPEPEPEEEQEVEEEEPVEEEAVVVKAATKTSTATKKPVVAIKAKAAPQQTEEILEVSEALQAHIKKSCQQFAGKQRLFVLARTSCKAGLLTDLEGCNKDCKDDALVNAHREQMTAICKSLVDQNLAVYSQKDESEIKWTG